MKKALEAKYVELFGNGSVYEYYRLKVLITLEEVNISVVEKKQNLYEKNFNDEANPSGVVNFHSMQMSFAISMHTCILSVMIGMTRHVHVGCCKLPFYANEFCDKHAYMHIVGDDWNDTPCSSLFSSLAMMQFRIEAIDIRVFFTRTKSIQKQIVEYIRYKK